MNLIVLGKEMISIGMAIGANETSAAHSFALFFATKEKKTTPQPSTSSTPMNGDLSRAGTRSK